MKRPSAHRGGSATDIHRNCFACGQGEDSLGLTFEQCDVDAVSAEWFCESRYQGYPGILHGGIISTILDCAMTNCLLMRDITAVTADMHVEYNEPVRVGDYLKVRASLVRSRSPLFVLDAQVLQDGRVKAKASARFMRAEVWSSISHV